VVDSLGRFWERLIVDTVGVVVVGFVLQGLWFAAGNAVTGWRPEFEPAYQKVSERFLALWVLGLGVGLAWGVRRAWSARRD
jgi:threonine/homoserine/homoserine lactone efflux protein